MELTQDLYRLWARAIVGLDPMIDEAIYEALAVLAARSIAMEGI